MRNYLPFYLKMTLPYTHLQTFVDKQPKKQFSCEFSENFETDIVIKASFRVSEVFSTLCTYIFCAAFTFQIKFKDSDINPYGTNFPYRFHASTSSQRAQQTPERCYAEHNANVSRWGNKP